MKSLVALTFFLLSMPIASSGDTINLEFLFTNANGVPVSDGSHTVLASIFSSSTGGSQLWGPNPIV